MEEDIEKIKIAIERYKEHGDNGDFLVNICSDYLLKDLEKSKEIYLELIEITESKGDRKTYARINNALGWYYHYTCNYDEAIKYRLKSQEIYEEINNAMGLMTVYNGLLSDFSMIGNYEVAIEQGLKAIELAEIEKNDLALGKFLINTVCCYTQCRKFKEAKETLGRMETYSSNFSPNDLIYYYAAIADVDSNLGNYENAMYYCEKAEALVMETKYSIIEDQILGVKACIHSKLGNEHEAEKFFAQSAKSAKNNKNISYFVKILVSWANHYVSNSKIEEAHEILKLALEKANEVNSHILKSELYEALSDVASRLGDFESAYKYHKIYFESEQCILNNRSEKWFAKLRSKEVEREAKMYKELYSDIDLISSIGKKLASNLRLEKNLTLIYDEVKMLVEADIFGVALYNDDSDTLSYDLFMIDGKKREYGEINLEKESLGRWCLRNKENVIMNDVESEVSRYISKRYELNKNEDEDEIVNSIIFCPLILEEKVIGIITVQSYKKNAYNKSNVKKFEILSSYIAIALQNTKLFNSIEYSANHDYLTGLFNRKKILVKGEELFENKKCSILIIDIDHFKKINDTYGHANGDVALKNVGDILLNSIENIGFVGRYGGEEFLVVANENRNEFVELLAENIRKKIENYIFDLDGIYANITVSIGTYCFTDKTINFYEGIALADKGLYEAKNTGRNKVVPYSAKLANDLLRI